MNKTIKALRRGIKAAIGPERSERFEVCGKVVICSHCGSDGFRRYGVLGASYGGYGLECFRCSHIEYFGKKPAERE
jgi:hypothetical protein